MRRLLAIAALVAVPAAATGCGGPRAPGTPADTGAPEPAKQTQEEPPQGGPAAPGWVALEPQTDAAGAAAPQPRADVSFAESFVGKHPTALVDALASNAQVAARLRSLLGAEYDEWRSRFQVAGAVQRKGALIVAEGCMPHSCAGARTAMVVVDVTENLISVGMVTDGRGRALSENGQVPAPIRDWLASESTR